jgi:hypothetical protein
MSMSCQFFFYRSLAHTESRAPTPISPAAQKFHVLILCSLLESSVIFSNSSVPGFILGKRHIADANQKMAEPHAAIRAAERRAGRRYQDNFVFKALGRDAIDRIDRTNSTIAEMQAFYAFVPTAGREPNSLSNN